MKVRSQGSMLVERERRQLQETEKRGDVRNEDRTSDSKRGCFGLGRDGEKKRSGRKDGVRKRPGRIGKRQNRMRRKGDGGRASRKGRRFCQAEVGAVSPELGVDAVSPDHS